MIPLQVNTKHEARNPNLLIMDETFETLLTLWEDIKLFFFEFTKFVFRSLHLSFLGFEKKKGFFVTSLYKERGKRSRQLTHTGMATLAALGVVMAPMIAQEFPGRSVNPWTVSVSPAVLSASTDDPGLDTQVSSKVRDSIIDYTVQAGDTVSTVAQKFGVSTDTIRWQNNLSGDKIKVGSTLRILPVTGIAHKVAKGDTVYSIAKKYDSESQAVVDFPFNSFSNDETFELAIGQTVIVPDGVMPVGTTATPRPRQVTPDAGTVVASGQFVWPTQGVITQRFSWYHPGLDIANRGGPLVVGADSGKVEFAGWDSSGYGSMVLINHGNGFKTRYAHLSQIMVLGGQNIKRGDIIGKMGSTGHSTGPHTHFEIYLNGVRLNPLNYLR
ncbi:MAG: Peptidase M23 family protein [Candidatus Woesebacteria bacterium GW2011_GWB1_39_10]|uniref:Peptidase M23 family protein n=1 Tax=Candidatus Woesebacteria bacterium GW2011_GWB1_39_10 TaxID=1618572 RepID=A0A0G0LKS9_9BACT|nr:MAG: Peptidase M23 family protein [Candidatus Woesebacteria bacterium GW2011_GWB1_39_10]